MNSYWAGAKVREYFTFMDETQSPPEAADPTAFTVKYKSPNGAISINTSWPGGGLIVHDSVGNFHIDIDTTGSITGVWTLEETSTGVQTSEVDNFYVNALPI